MSIQLVEVIYNYHIRPKRYNTYIINQRNNRQTEKQTFWERLKSNKITLKNHKINIVLLVKKSM